MQNFKLKVESVNQFLERFVAEGDLKVKRATSVKVGIVFLLLYVVLASPMVYFKVKFMPFLVSILALFSLTTSYLIPTIYRIQVEKPVLTNTQTLLREEDDAHMNLDFGKPYESVELDKNGKVMQNYFNQYKGQRKGGKKKKDQGGNACKKTCVLILNFTLVSFIVCCYGLIVFNFIYHVVKPYID